MGSRDFLWEDEDLTPASEGLFVAAFFSDESQRQLAAYCAANKIPNPVPAPSLHSTIVYSRVPVPEFDLCLEPLEIEVNMQLSKLAIWDIANNKRCLVLQLTCPYLDLRFLEGMAAGATYDFDEYKAHVTLSYDVGDLDVQTLPLPNFNLTIAGEYSEAIDLTR